MEHQYKTLDAEYSKMMMSYSASGSSILNILDNKTKWLDPILNYYPEVFVPEILNDGYQLVSVTENPEVSRTYHFVK